VAHDPLVELVLTRDEDRERLLLRAAGAAGLLPHRRDRPRVAAEHAGVERADVDAELDLDDRVAYVEPSAGDELTQTRSETDIRILETDDVTDTGRGVRLCIGGVEVCEQVVGYQRKDTRTGEVLGMVDLDLPPTRLITRAFWWSIDPSVLARAGVVPGAWPGTLHAAEHAAIGMLPLFTICDRWDVGGVSTALQADTGRPTIVIYDGYPGGAGIAELGYASGAELLARTLEAIDACPCTSGCPSCVQSPKCGNLNEPLDKHGAAALLRQMTASTRPARRAG
jgi:DEAD/DEAH box helicase domain-containing protein